MIHDEAVTIMHDPQYRVNADKPEYLIFKQSFYGLDRRYLKNFFIRKEI